eukprot:364283-Chlamydomonas_euryale.AAC.38
MAAASRLHLTRPKKLAFAAQDGWAQRHDSLPCERSEVWELCFGSLASCISCQAQRHITHAETPNPCKASPTTLTASTEASCRCTPERHGELRCAVCCVWVSVRTHVASARAVVLACRAVQPSEPFTQRLLPRCLAVELSEPLTQRL